MKWKSAVGWAGLLVCAASFLAGNAAAQRAQGAKASTRAPAYNLARESTVVGTVTKFTASSEAPPIGAHVLLATAAGPVDVHLGDARFLKLNNLTITEGATLRVLGQNATSAGRSIFLARVVQQGTQALRVRSNNGIPFSGAGLRASPAQKTQALAQSKRGGAQ